MWRWWRMGVGCGRIVAMNADTAHGDVDEGVLLATWWMHHDHINAEKAAMKLGVDPVDVRRMYRHRWRYGKLNRTELYARTRAYTEGAEGNVDVGPDDVENLSAIEAVATNSRIVLAIMDARRNLATIAQAARIAGVEPVVLNAVIQTGKRDTLNGRESPCAAVYKSWIGLSESTVGAVRGNLVDKALHAGSEAVQVQASRSILEAKDPAFAPKSKTEVTVRHTVDESALSNLAAILGQMGAKAPRQVVDATFTTSAPIPVGLAALTMDPAATDDPAD